MSSEHKAFASLSSGLLARKGDARPAMRRQNFGEMGQGLDDLGWNDMGDDAPAPQPGFAQTRRYDDGDDNDRGVLAALGPLAGLSAAKAVHDHIQSESQQANSVRQQQADIMKHFAISEDEASNDSEDYVDETAELWDPEAEDDGANAFNEHQGTVKDYSADKEMADLDPMQIAQPEARSDAPGYVPFAAEEPEEAEAAEQHQPVEEAFEAPVEEAVEFTADADEDEVAEAVEDERIEAIETEFVGEIADPESEDETADFEAYADDEITQADIVEDEIEDELVLDEVAEEAAVEEAVAEDEAEADEEDELLLSAEDEEVVSEESEEELVLDQPVEEDFSDEDETAEVEDEDSVAAVVPMPTPAREPVRFARPRRPRVAAGSKDKAAFTLRLDKERHLRLRLASALTGQSAQKMLIEALDKMLDDMPELEAISKKEVG